MYTADLFMDDYFSGKKLYGDDFTYEQIQAWYADEKEGYANLVAEFEWAESHGAHGYHELNTLHGFRYIRWATGVIRGTASPNGSEEYP